MKFHFPRAIVWLVAGWSAASGLHAQSLPQLENDYRNIFSYQPANQWPPPAPSLDVDPRVPSANQWRSGSSIGGWQTHRIPQTGPVLAGPRTDAAGNTTLVYPRFTPLDGNGDPISGQGVALTSAIIGRPIVGRAPTVFFGDIIARPNVDQNGMPVDPISTYLPNPENVATGQFYYSQHAQRVFATQSGVIEVVWRFRDPARVPATLSLTYVVSSSPAPGRETKRIFWTERGFTGPKVEIPQGPIQKLEIIYNSQVPAAVATEYVSPYYSPLGPAIGGPDPVLSTFWQGSDGLLHAYNKEGRVFLEFLGAENRETGLRPHLGSEIVELVREVSPAVVNVHVGDRILPHDGSTDLEATIINGSDSFVYMHPVVNKNEIHYYSTRTTTPTVTPGQATGEVLFYWLRRGQLNVLWPRFYDTYISTWPDNVDSYTRYVRQDSGQGDAGTTAVMLDPTNNSSLVFQDDPTGTQTHMTDGTTFYTNINALDPTGRSLIRHISGDHIWFERVYSQLNTTFAGASTEVDAVVGARINPPEGHEDAVGYIRETPNVLAGRAYDPVAYKNPFVVGAVTAKEGAIIPVNARPDDDTLEIWWYKKSNPPAGVTLKANYWPVSVQKYHLKWPENGDKIVMASNEGTGDLPSYQATGTLYVQNNNTLPGFNPNDEHALMISGRAYALRDDLATPTTSEPFVLMRYNDLDSRPSMRVFKVWREDLANNIVFNYQAEAGKVLQAPMPLPVMPPVYKSDRVFANEESSPLTEDLPANGKASAIYKKFTFTDRKGTVWVYRGPHVEGATGKQFEMRYYYGAQEGFYIPGVTTQPKVGDVMPYLREIDASTGNFKGSATGTGKQALRVTFRPVWPDDAATLLLGETLTLPTKGLPAVRGQTSLEIIYDQSKSNDPTDETTAAVIFDPTVAKVSSIAEANLLNLPDSVYTNSYQGRLYFPNLPPHLVDRFYFDANIGEKGSLVLVGQFKDEVLGEDYLLLNTLSPKDTDDLKGLCVTTDIKRAEWNTAIDNLGVVVEKHVPDPARPGTFIPASLSQSSNSTKIWNWITAPERRWNLSAQAENLKFFGLLNSSIGDGHTQWLIDHGKPSASDVVSGAGLGSNKDAENAVAWISDHLTDLQDWDRKRKAEGEPDGTKDQLASSLKSHLENNSPSVSINSIAALFSDRQAISDWILNANARNWDDVAGQALTKANFVAGVTWQLTGNNRTKLEDAGWSFITKKRSELENWTRSLEDPTEDTIVLSLLREDFFASEISANQTVAGDELVEINSQDIPVDSYALTGSGGGEGWVVLAAGNSKIWSPQEEPVSLLVFRVTNPLGRGELKVIQPSNPLSEKLTLQHSFDFAAKPADYEFEWRTLPPVDGQPPVVYTFDAETVVANASWTLTTVGGDSRSVNLPGVIPLATGDNTAAQSVSHQFTLTDLPFRAFLSFDISSNDGARVLVNGISVAARGITGTPDTATTIPPGSSFSPLPYAYEVPVSLLKTGANNITVELSTRAAVGSASYLNVRLEAMQETDLSTTWMALSPNMTEQSGSLGVSILGKNRHVIEGNSILTLTDNYFICRFRARDTGHAGYDATGGWSKWTEPQLAEGWIKRALAGLNPFEQRIKDLYNNDVNTDVSLVTQAGKRWEGDVALNLENIDSFGLIEIYETILRRGKGLSIEGIPTINYGPANDALLLAAGYLNDLYMILGNEAYADAANPTIAFSTNAGEFGDVATSLFSFKGQLATVLDEELSLLRGRDDFLTPGTRVTPVFNRLVWNYTRGIDSGEAIYALNYNIKDLTGPNVGSPPNGVVGAEDAARGYPQGHGDAYGHYLTAITNYYGLLWNEHFSWTPRTEAVLVLGKPVSVDYFDERKFAGASAAWAKTASQVVDLTYRHAYSPADTQTTWTHLKDGRNNDRTGVTRHWGVDDWASRGGQGTFFHWLTANSMLPDVDPDPAHEGIQKIDRTTVPELGQIVLHSEAIQRSLDTANAGLNPLGLSNGAVSFDISPAEVDDGKTHYEQVYERALGSLTNAVTAFDRAKSSTQFLRSQEDSLAEQREAILAQERAFEAQLRDLYGTPYPDDIGPGKTYAQGYEGPDLYHYKYVDLPELFKNSGEADLTTQTFKLAGDTNFGEALESIDDWGGTTNYSDPKWYVGNDDKPTEAPPSAGQGQMIEFVLDSNGQYHKPSTWTGRRAQPGSIQQAISGVQMARLQLHNALEDYANFGVEFRRIARTYKAAVIASSQDRNRQVRDASIIGAKELIIAAIEQVEGWTETVIKTGNELKEIKKEIPPRVTGVANDVTSAARAAAIAANLTKDVFAFGKQQALDLAKGIAEQAIANLERASEIESYDIAWRAEHLGLLTDLKAGFEELEDGTRTIDEALRAYLDAQENVRVLDAQGATIQKEREIFRMQAAALIQGYRTKDFGFRAFRDEALESYKSLFDLAARYTYLAARAYDYETGLVDAAGGASAKNFFQQIVRSRALGVISDGVPQIAGSTGGDPGLSGALARMNSDWSVVKNRFGFNNPDLYLTTFSLRRENLRIVDGETGDIEWKDFLASAKMSNILEDEDVRRHCLNVNSGASLAVPGFVISFQTTISTGFNFFGKPLAGGDSTFSPTSFATKIRSTGVAFPGYVGMASPNGFSGTGSTSPSDPPTGFSDPNSMSATPYIYVIPAGVDSMRAPSLMDSNIVRSWKIEDQAIPLPFDVGGAFSSSNILTGGLSLSEPFVLRKHQAFRAVSEDTDFTDAPQFTNSRLIGRSVWNSRWKIIIPGHTLHANPINGMKSFEAAVKDILIHFSTYSYSGN